MLEFVAVKWFTEIEWSALEDRERFPYNQNEETFVVLPVELPSIRRCANGTKV